MGRLARVALTIGLAALLLALALKGADWPGFAQAVATMDPRVLALAFAIQTGAMLCRGARWNVLLSAHRGASFKLAFFGEMFGYLGNNFLPARAGEAMRAYVVGRRVKGGMSFALGTIAMERVSDAVFMALAAFAVVAWLPQSPPWLLGAAGGLFAAGVGVILVLLFTARFRKLVLWPLKRIGRLAAVTGRVEVLLGRFSQGTLALYQPRRLAAFLGLTMAVWSLDVLALTVIAAAMGLSLSAPQALLFQAAIALSKAVPSTPGYVGVYQFVAASVLPPFGFSASQALAYVLVYQGALIVQSMLWGLPGWLILGANGTRPPPRKRRRRKPAAILQSDPLQPDPGAAQ